MTDKNNEPAPSGASSLFGCGTDGAASDGDRERSADEILQLMQHLMKCRERRLRMQLTGPIKLDPKINGRVREVRRVWGICEALRAEEAANRQNRITEGR